MTINLSEHAGGGEIYNPPMMEYDNHIFTRTIGLSGNKVEVVARVNLEEQTGGSVQYIQRVSTRVLLVMSDSDHATTERQNKIGFLVWGDGNSTLVYLHSKLAYAGKEALIYGSYDGDTGEVSFRINGEDADDLNNPARVAPVTGTVSTASGDTFVGGYQLGLPCTGQIGFIGYNNDNSGWETVMTSKGTPIKFDWTDWEFFNPYGNMDETAYYGSGLDFTYNVGSDIRIAETGFTQLPALGLPTIGDAVAADILADKIAWVDGVKLVGTGSSGASYSNKVMSYEIGGGPVGVYTGVEDDIQYGPGVVLSAFTESYRDGNGWLTCDDSNSYIYYDLPAETTTMREHAFIVAFTDGADYPDRFQFIISREDGSNLTYCRLMYTSGGWQMNVTDVIAGAETVRIQETPNNVVRFPAQMKVVIRQDANLVHMTMIARETDTTNEETVYAIKTTGATSRTSIGGGVQMITTTGNRASVKLHSIEITDIPNIS